MWDDDSFACKVLVGLCFILGAQVTQAYRHTSLAGVTADQLTELLNSVTFNPDGDVLLQKQQTVDSSASLLNTSRKPTDRDHVFQIADLHGDYLQFSRLMEKLGLMHPTDESWVGGSSWAIFTGDYVDRGLDSADILHTLVRLTTEADSAGGGIILIKGNHEEMISNQDYHDMEENDARAWLNVAGNNHDWGKKGYQLNYDSDGCTSPHWRCKFEGGCHTSPALRAALDTALGPESKFGELIGSMPIMSLAATGVGQKTLFVHGGVTWHMVKQVCGLNKGKCTKSEDDLVDAVSALARKDTVPEYHPLWNRDVAKQKETCGNVLKTLKAFGAERMVLGHTVLDTDKVTDVYEDIAKHVTPCKGKVFLTDRGVSRGMQRCLKNSYGGLTPEKVGALWFPAGSSNVLALYEMDVSDWREWVTPGATSDWKSTLKNKEKGLPSAAVARGIAALRPQHSASELTTQLEIWFVMDDLLK